jgi:hypothetical protein
LEDFLDCCDRTAALRDRFFCVLFFFEFLLSTRHTIPTKNCVETVFVNAYTSFPFLIAIDQFAAIAAWVYARVASIFITESVVAPAIVIAT